MTLGEERRRLPTQRVIGQPGIDPSVDTKDILQRYFYDPKLVLADCDHLLGVPFGPINRIDHDRIHAIKKNPRFGAWLQLNESSLLLLNANSDGESSLDMSFVSAQVFQSAEKVSTEQANIEAKVIPLAFFCSQHRDYRRDAYGAPSELAISLLLQLVNTYRGFIPEDLAAAFDDFNPEDIGSIFTTFDFLVSRLPATVMVFLIVDGLRYFGYPKKRRDEMTAVVAGLVDIYRREHTAKLKFLFANSTRADFLEHLFPEEKLQLPRELWIEQGYNTRSWTKRVNLGRLREQAEATGSDDRF